MKTKNTRPPIGCILANEESEILEKYLKLREIEEQDRFGIEKLSGFGFMNLVTKEFPEYQFKEFAYATPIGKRIQRRERIIRSPFKRVLYKLYCALEI